MPTAPLASFLFAQGGSTVTGTGAGTFAFAGPVVGVRTRHGVCLGAFSFSGTAVGVVIGWGIPQNLVANAISSSEIDLTWDAVPHSTGYDIERDGAVVVFDHSTNSYNDTGLEPSTEYDYRVRAVG